MFELAQHPRDIVKDWIKETFNPISSGNFKMSRIPNTTENNFVVYHESFEKKITYAEIKYFYETISKIALEDAGYRHSHVTLALSKDEYFRLSGEKPKIMVSLPMRGRSMVDVEAEILQIYEDYKDRYDLINQIHNTGNGEVANLGHSIMMMGDADFVVFSPDWKHSTGCALEREICEKYNIDYCLL